MEVNLESLKNLAFPGVNPEDIATLSKTSKSTVLRHESIVAKCHFEVDKDNLYERIRTIQESEFQSIFLQPNLPTYHYQNEKVDISYWPEAERLSPNKLTKSIWSEIGILLAKLHSTPLKKIELRFPSELFKIFSDINEKLQRCNKQCAAGSKHRTQLKIIYQAWISILTHKNFHKVVKDIRLRPKVWSHGDFHLGQIVFIKDQENSSARFIDIDTICHSIPEWDLARPSALFAAGILPAPLWRSFIESYFELGLKQTLNEKILWSNLDMPAKVMTIKLACLALNRATLADEQLEDTEMQLIETCKAIGREC